MIFQCNIGWCFCHTFLSVILFYSFSNFFGLQIFLEDLVIFVGFVDVFMQQLLIICGTGDCNFTKQFYNHRKSFDNKTSANIPPFEIFTGTKRNIKFKSNSSMVHCQKSTTLVKYSQEVPTVPSQFLLHNYKINRLLQSFDNYATFNQILCRNNVYNNITHSHEYFEMHET